MLRLLATNAFWSFVSHALSRGCMMLAALLLARHLDVGQFAAYSYFQLTASMLAAYGAMGLGVSASRYFAEIGHNRTDSSPPPLGTLWGLSWMLAALAAIAVLAMPAGWLSGGMPVSRSALALGVLLLIAGVVPGGAIIGLERFKHAALVSAVSGSTMLLGTWRACVDGSAAMAVGALLSALAVQTIGESLLVVRALGLKSLNINADRFVGDVRRVFSFAGPMTAVSLVASSGSWLLGRIILSGPTGERGLAMYAIGMQWFSLALLLPGILSRVLLPRIVRTESADESRNLVRRTMWATIGVASAMTAIAVALGPVVVALYGGAFGAGRWFIGAFMAAATMSAPANTIGNAIVANNGQQAWLVLSLLWLASLMLIGALGISTGAWIGALAQGVAAMLLTSGALIVARRRGLV